MKLRKLGAYASIAAVFIFLFIMILIPSIGNSNDPSETIAAYQASPFAFKAFYVGILILGILALIIVMALQEWMRSQAPHRMHLAVIATSIYCAMNLAMAMNGFIRTTLLEAGEPSVYNAALFVWNNLGKAGGYAWGLGFLLIGWAALSTRMLPRILAIIFLLRGVLTIPTLFIEQPLSAFLLPLSLVCYLWLGIVLLYPVDSDRQET